MSKRKKSKIRRKGHNFHCEKEEICSDMYLWLPNQNAVSTNSMELSIETETFILLIVLIV